MLKYPMRSMLPCTSNPAFLKALYNQFQCSLTRTANLAIVVPVICTHDCASRNHTVLVNEVDLYFWHATNSISQPPKESFVQHDRRACFPCHRKVNPTACFQLQFHCGFEIEVDHFLGIQLLSLRTTYSYGSHRLGTYSTSIGLCGRLLSSAVF